MKAKVKGGGDNDHKIQAIEGRFGTKLADL